jgi:3-hydroxybutyryl-CoA dehydrogenase
VLSAVGESGSSLGAPVVVLGAGMMGSEIGVEFALHGIPVSFLDSPNSRGNARVRETVERARELGLADDARSGRALEMVTVVERIEELPPACRLVIECLPEDLDTKARVLSAVADHLPNAILGSNTSSLSIAELGRSIGASQRTLGMHYWNPPLLMPLVEIVAGPDTDPVAVDTACDMVVAVGKTVVRVRRDVPGFIWNRLQMAVLREALWLVDNEVATMDDIDRVTQLGLARRWRQTGLFASVYLGNPRQWERIAGNLFPMLSSALSAAGLADRVLANEEEWAGSRERRDQALAKDLG